MAKPTAEEYQLIDLFRQKLRDLNLSSKDSADHELLRWIRARNHDLEKAEQFYRKSLAWRLENGYVNLSTRKFPEALEQGLKLVHAGYDAENAPILLIYMGDSDLPKLFKACTSNDIISYYVFHVEQAVDAINQRLGDKGWPVTQVISLWDNKGISMSSMLNPRYCGLVLECAKALANVLPERMKKIGAINSGSAISMVVNMAKPFLSEETQQKLGICGTGNVPEFIQTFLPTVRADMLCPRWGGTKECPFDFCCNSQQGY